MEFLPGEGLRNFVSPNFIILFSPIFSGCLRNTEFGPGGGVCRDNFLPPAGLAGTGGGGLAGGGPGVTLGPKEFGLKFGPGGARREGGGGRLGGLPLLAMAGGWK